MSGRDRARLSALAAMLLCLAPPTLAAQARETRPGATPDARDLDEDGQLRKLPRLPQGMTLQMIREGDELYRGKGGCVACHGPDGGGMPAAGSGITSGLNFVPSEWGPIDSVIRVGVPEPVTRTPMAMPPAAQANLSQEETRRIAAYVWAISQVRGEPWEGGHTQH